MTYMTYQADMKNTAGVHLGIKLAPNKHFGKFKKTKIYFGFYCAAFLLHIWMYKWKTQWIYWSWSIYVLLQPVVLLDAILLQLIQQTIQISRVRVSVILNSAGNSSLVVNIPHEDVGLSSGMARSDTKDEPPIPCNLEKIQSSISFRWIWKIADSSFRRDASSMDCVAYFNGTMVFIAR